MLFEVRVSWDDRRHLLGRFDTQAEAETVLAIARGQIAAGTFVAPADAKRARRAEQAAAEAARFTYGEWAEEWLRRLESAGRTPSTIVSYRSILKTHVLPTLRTVALQDITPEMVEELLAEVRAKRSRRYPDAGANGVTSTTSGVLRSSLNAAVRAKRIRVSPYQLPTPARTRVRPGDPRDDVATITQVRALEEAMPEGLALAVPLAAWCQLRIGEVLGLQRQDFTGLDTPENAFVHIVRQFNGKTSTLTPPKSKAGTRSLSVPPDMVPRIRAHLEQHAAPGEAGFVFPGRNPTAPVSETAFDKRWRAARDVAGLPGFRFHDLRHTGLTMYAQLGATQAELMHRGGHTNVETVARYQHATLERDRALADALSRALAVPSIGARPKKGKKKNAG